MIYKIELSDPAKDFLKKVNKADAKRIAKKIDNLETSPRPHGVAKLSGEERSSQSKCDKI